MLLFYFLLLSGFFYNDLIFSQAKNLNKRNLHGLGSSLPLESLNENKDNLKNLTARNYCYCSYGDSVCDRNNSCVKHEHAACYHATQEGFNDEIGRMETWHYYGCAPLEKGSNGSYLTCNTWRGSHSSPKSIACCYEGNYCNLNITPPAYSNIVEDDYYESNISLESRLESSLTYVIIGVITGAITLILIYIFLRCLQCFGCCPNFFGGFKKTNQNRNSLLGIQENDKVFGDSECTWESGSGSGSGLVTLNQRTIALNLTMLDLVARGRYGEVRRAIYRGSIVAVKTFYTTEEESWKNERAVYQTQMLNHENILQYVASDISSNLDALTQMLLITDYHPLGSLYDYLRRTEPLDLMEALGYIQTIIAGLEHMHNAVHGTGSRRKPQIAHRDMKSKNIIVKRPGVCCIADFGLAVRLEEDQILPQKLNVQVGTKRYMAPEVLNNSLNIMNFDEFKMADIYSFSLVMWEVCNRIQTSRVNNAQKSHKRMISFSSSSGIATSSSVPSSYAPLRYRPVADIHVSRDSCSTTATIEVRPPSLPYQNFVELDPSFEEMKKIVCWEGKRPYLEDEWTNGSNVVLKVLTEVMQECWASRAKSRHTAYKVKKELHDIIVLAQRVSEEVIVEEHTVIRGDDRLDSHMNLV